MVIFFCFSFSSIYPESCCLWGSQIIQRSTTTISNLGTILHWYIPSWIRGIFSQHCLSGWGISDFSSWKVEKRWARAPGWLCTNIWWGKDCIESYHVAKKLLAWLWLVKTKHHCMTSTELLMGLRAHNRRPYILVSMERSDIVLRHCRPLLHMLWLTSF